MTTSIPWTKFQDFYLRLGFLKVLVAVLGAERRSVPNDTITRRANSPLFQPLLDHPAFCLRVADRLSWYGPSWREGAFDPRRKTPSVAEALVVEGDLPSLLFALTGPTTYKMLDWGRDIGLLGRGNQITERGLTLRALIDTKAASAFLGGDVDAWNPFVLTRIEQLFFLFHLFEIDDVTARVVDKVATLSGKAAELETADASRIVAIALNEVLADCDRNVRPHDIPALRTALELAATISDEMGVARPESVADVKRRLPKPLSPAARRKQFLANATGAEPRRTSKNADHQTVPRFEQLCDLGFLVKPGATDDLLSRRRWRWTPTDVARRWASARSELRLPRDRFLGEGFARAARYAFGDEPLAERCRDTPLVAHYLSRGYRAVHRAVGQTPLDSAALMATCLAVADGHAIEMTDFHDLMLEIKFGGHLQGEVYFASGNDLDKMFISMRENFALRAAEVLPGTLSDPSDRRSYQKGPDHD